MGRGSDNRTHVSTVQSVRNSQPLLYLDVDGVIALGIAPSQAGDFSGVEVVEVNAGFSSPLPQVVSTGIQEVFAGLDDLFEIVWCSAWFSRADTAWAKRIGIRPGKRFLNWGNMKLPELLADVGDRRFAFIDDDMSFELRSFEGILPDSALLIEPDHKTGITLEHRKQLIEFASA